MSSDQSNQSWCLRHDGKVLLRDNGVLLYHGPEQDMPEELKALADEFTVPFSEVAGKLLGGQDANI